MKAGKAAGGRSAKSTKKKTAGRRAAGGIQDATESSAAGTRASTATRRAAKRAPGSAPRKSRRGCGGCPVERVVEDPIEVAKRTMKGSVPAIVEAMVKKAKQGSCPHAKTLLEMTGAKFMFDDGPEKRGAGAPWAKLVLERMEEAAQEKLPNKPSAEKA